MYIPLIPLVSCLSEGELNTSLSGTAGNYLGTVGRVFTCFYGNSVAYVVTCFKFNKAIYVNTAAQITLVKAQDKAENEVKYPCIDEEHQHRHAYGSLFCFA